MKKSKLIRIIASTLMVATLTSYGMVNNVYAESGENVVETYNNLDNQLKEMTKELSQNFSPSDQIPEEYTIKISNIKQEMFNLVSSNPNSFKDQITSDQDKENDYKNQEILNKLEKEEKSSNKTIGQNPLSSGSSSGGGGSSHWNNYGDIFTSTTNLLEASHSLTGHSGIGAYTWGETIESYPAMANVAGGAGVQRRNQYYTRWTPDSSFGVYRVKNTSSGAYGPAYDYAVSKIGEPYNDTFSSSGSGYYCSELVYFCWKHADNKHIRVYNGESAIAPWELAASDSTYEIDRP
ncbi:MAG: hypothetical protein DBY38_00295 [Clostridium cadaveris]|uniref:Uncharacterized protein n=1 Tax=Clostridium cadaveris TaxID=1529 RepID=A0A316MBA9_9CLOT|nr:MAG: hypothetical protein DBY38_00295 [Clostridium cadaveris]